MSCTVSHYWEEHAQHSLPSLVPVAAHDGGYMVLEEPGGQAGFIDATVVFPNESVLRVREWVHITSRGPRREKYSYDFRPSGDRATVRFDFDPTLDDPALRRHINRPGGVHEGDRRRTLKPLVELFWKVDADPSLSGDDIP